MKKLVQYFSFILLLQMPCHFAFAQKQTTQTQVAEEDNDDENDRKGIEQEGEFGIIYWKKMEEIIREKNRQNGIYKDRTQFRLSEYNKEKTSLQKGALSIAGSWLQVPQVQSSIGMGRIEDIAFNASNPNSFYIAASGGGVWKTNNFGTSYVPLTDGLPTGGVSCIAMDTIHPNIIYIFAGGGLGGSNYYPGIIYKTTDSGATWMETGFKNIENNMYGYELKVHPTNANILFVATNYGIYRSINAGNTWKKVLIPIGQPNFSVFDIEFKPGEPSVVYAVSANKLWVSKSGGDTASWISSTMPAPPTSIQNYTASRLAVSWAAPGKCYIANSVKSVNDSVATANGEVFFVAVSFDTATNVFTWGASKKIGACGYQCMRSGGGRVYGDIVASPKTAGNIMVGGLEFFASANNGDTWVPKSFGCPNTGNRIFHVDAGKMRYNKGGIFVAMDGGVVSQAENYTSNTLPWQNITGGIEITQSYTHDASVLNTEFFALANQDNDVQVRTATTYSDFIGGDGTMCQISKLEDNLYYGAVQAGAFLRRHSSAGDAGITPRKTNIINWVPADTAQFAVDTAEYGGSFVFAKAFALNEYNSNIIFCAKKAMYRSTNRGDTWTRFPITNATHTHYLLKVAKFNANRMYTIEDYSGMFQRTSDGGVSWLDLTAKKPYNGYITDLVNNPADQNDIYISYAGNTDTAKVFRSIDGGLTWTNLSVGLPNVDVRCMTLAANAAHSIYVGNDFGVYYRDDNIGHWINYSNNLPVVFVNSLVYDNTNQRITAGTYGRGVWTSDVFDAGSCVANQALNNTYVNRHQYTASNDITSTGDILGSANSTIKFSAGHQVILQPGFVAEANSNFVASAEGCIPVASGYKMDSVHQKATEKQSLIKKRKKISRLKK